MKNRLPSGGRINRDSPLTFTFNGRKMQGFAGDTIASALLANNVRIVSRSFKYHRPRGIYSAGAEEPSAVFAVGTGGLHTPNVRATLTPLVDGMSVRSQGGWPSVEYDVGAIMSAFSRILPAGFYYKTFMRPTKLWMFYEKLIRHAASFAPPPTQKDASRYTHRHAHCDVLIVGGGAAGLAAALAAGQVGADVILADMGTEFGGQLLNESHPNIDEKPVDAWLADTIAALGKMANVRLLSQTTIQGYHDYNYLIGVQTQHAPGEAGKGVRQRLWKIRARRVVITAGAIERPLLFAGNDVPGVMLSSAVQTYIHRYGVLPGRSILFLTNNDSTYAHALAAAAAGARVEIADIRNDEDGGFWQRQAKDKNIQIYPGMGVIAARNAGGFIATELGYFQNDKSAQRPHASHRYDIIAVSGGWTPTVHLFSQARGALEWSERLGAFKPNQAHSLNPCRAAGAANGAFHLSQCLEEGNAAGLAAANECGISSKSAAEAPITESPVLERAAIYPAFLPSIDGQGGGKCFVDLMNDVTVSDIEIAQREGYRSVEHMKRYTVSGFGTDQGKTGNINALVVLAKSLGLPPGEVGHTTYRPNYTPMPFGAVVGEDRDNTYAQRRSTPIDPWHRSKNAVDEDVGDWKRPRYFPLEGESMDDAVWRECKAARDSVAMMDASTLGKIDIRGPDAAAFLDMIYTNLFSTLPVGRCRYGLMLHETGMIFDDGVTARLGEHHYHMTTSTGHAAAVMTWLEEWLQTEWPTLRVFCTSVTEQWTVISVAGPKARALLAEVTDMPLSAEAFPFMSVQEGVVAGAPARVFRISFSGESAFEINVPARYGLAVWETLFALGEKHGITPYGTESMHVLRAEKGYIIVGQDSDGTMIADDMGLSWMLSKKKTDFVGRRSLARPDMQRDGRLQLVGLLPTDPKMVIREGAQVIATDAGAVSAGSAPIKTQGHITSSYMSPTLERSFALAMIANGRQRHGETINTLYLDGQRIAAEICAPVFFDVEGGRLRG